jgi:hypothetical protein
MILVHQMAKVASQSWIEVAKAATDDGDAPVHCHFVTEDNRARMESALRDLRPTIANMIVPKTILRGGVAGAAAIEKARTRHEKIKVVTGVRDPVARSISLIIFFTDFIGHTQPPLNPRSQKSADDVIGALRETWEAVLEHREPDATFEWLLWFLTGVYASWFEDELQAVFGANIRGTQFVPESQRFDTSLAEILAYRVEDMLPAARDHAHLLAVTSEFFGYPVTTFPNVNRSQARRSHVLYDEVRRRFRLPAEVLDAIYGVSVMRHFYRPDEIDFFKSCWSV